VLSLWDARVVSCTNLRNCRKLSRSDGIIPSKRTRTSLAGLLRVTTPLSANPFTQTFPLGAKVRFPLLRRA